MRLRRGRHLPPAPSGGSPPGRRWARRLSSTTPRRRARTPAEARQHPPQFQPQGVTIQKAAKWGARRPGRQRPGHGVQRRRALQAHPRDVLPAPPGHRDGSVVAAVERLLAARSRPRRAPGRRSRPAAGRPALGRDRQLPRLRRPVSAKYTLFTTGGLPIGPCSVALRGDAERAVAAEPHLRQRRRAPLAHAGGGRHAGPPSPYGSTATRRLARGRAVQRRRRPLRAAHGEDRLLLPTPRAGDHVLHQHLPRRDRRPAAPADVALLLTSASSATASASRPVRAALPRPGPPGADQDRREGGLRRPGLGVDERQPGTGAADDRRGDRPQSEFDSGGRLRRPARVRRGAPAVPRPAYRAYTQMTASNIAVKVAQRAGLPRARSPSTTTVYEHVPRPARATGT